MQGVVRRPSAIFGSKGSWSGFHRVRGSDQLPPPGDGVVAGKNRDDHLSARGELDERLEERLAFVFGVEAFGLIRRQLDRVQIEDPHVVLNDFGQDVSDVAVSNSVGLDDHACVLKHVGTVQSNVAKTFNHDSVDEMERTLASFARWNRVTVISADDPGRRMMGFSAFYMEDGLEHSILVEMRVTKMKQEIERLNQIDPGRAKAWMDRRQIALGYATQDKPVFQCDVCGSTSWMVGFDPTTHDVDECNERLTKSVMET